MTWQQRLKPKQLTSHPKCQVQIDYKSHPVLYNWISQKSRDNYVPMTEIVRAILYDAMESELKT